MSPIVSPVLCCRQERSAACCAERNDSSRSGVEQARSTLQQRLPIREDFAQFSHMDHTHFGDEGLGEQDFLWGNPCRQIVSACAGVLAFYDPLDCPLVSGRSYDSDGSKARVIRLTAWQAMPEREGTDGVGRFSVWGGHVRALRGQMLAGLAVAM